MLAAVQAATLLGVDGHRVRVEVHVSSGLPGFTVVGLPDTSCREARDRVRAALMTSGLTFPVARVTVNLAPGELRKAGTALDLAVAMGLLVASEQLPPEVLRGRAFLGELGLDGSIRQAVGMLPLCCAIASEQPVVSLDDVAEARLVRGDAVGASTLGQLVAALRGEAPWEDAPPVVPDAVPGRAPDLAEVRGHVLARRALEVSAAGGHHLLMVGPPGAGKTMLAERLPGLLPDLDDHTALEVSRVHSAAGAMRGAGALLRRPPFRSPHHTASLVALVGGGSSVLRPGEISLASGGVLFLDELGEFPASHLDALRQPLESGEIRVSRAMVGATLPARFLLVAASNPCPCGSAGWASCSCTPAQLARYVRRLSGPFLDRFDLRVPVDPPDPALAVAAGVGGECSAAVRERVAAARERALGRGVGCNRQLRGADLDRWAPLAPAAADALEDRLARGLLTMRGAQRVRAVALTLLDLAGGEPPLDLPELDLAVSMRGDSQVVGSAA